MNNIKDFNASKIFLIITLFFGLASILLAFPLSNGDEGYHLSKSYQFFSSDYPMEMSEKF